MRRLIYAFAVRTQQNLLYSLIIGTNKGDTCMRNKKTTSTPTHVYKFRKIPITEVQYMLWIKTAYADCNSTKRRRHLVIEPIRYR